MLTAYGKNSHFNIQEWVINENFSKGKPDNQDDCLLSKKTLRILILYCFLVFINIITA